MDEKIYEMMDGMCEDDAACWLMMNIYMKTIIFNIQLKLCIKYLVRSEINLICKKNSLHNDLPERPERF